MIDSGAVRSARALQARARSFVRHVITPTVAAAAETYPEFSVTEILALCEPALTRELVFELESAFQQAVPESHNRRDRAGRTSGRRFLLRKPVIDFNLRFVHSGLRIR
jgi:hypothetical protein